MKSKISRSQNFEITETSSQAPKHPLKNPTSAREPAPSVHGPNIFFWNPNFFVTFFLSAKPSIRATLDLSIFQTQRENGRRWAPI